MGISEVKPILMTWNPMGPADDTRAFLGSWIALARFGWVNVSLRFVGPPPSEAFSDKLGEVPDLPRNGIGFLVQSYG